MSALGLAAREEDAHSPGTISYPLARPVGCELGVGLRLFPPERASGRATSARTVPRGTTRENLFLPTFSDGPRWAPSRPHGRLPKLRCHEEKGAFTRELRHAQRAGGQRYTVASISRVHARIICMYSSENPRYTRGCLEWSDGSVAITRCPCFSYASPPFPHRSPTGPKRNSHGERTVVGG